MSYRILLISVNRCNFPYPVFPLGLAHLSSTLIAAGYETKLYDMQVDSDDIIEVIGRFKPDCIGLSLRNIDDIQINNTSFYAPLLSEVAEKMRTNSVAPLVLGGSGFSLFPDKLLEITKADFGIYGEGETSFTLLLSYLRSKGNYETIPGLVFRKEGKIIINPKEPGAVNTFAPLQRPKHLTDYYLKHSSILNVQTQRGCAFKCCYCTYPLIEGSTLRYRNPESVCDEIADAVASGAKYFCIVDSVFNTCEKHLVAICEEIIRREIKIKWVCYMRPKDITQSMLDTMVRAGLTHIEFGTDSLCDSILESYGKDFTFDDIVNASECARKAGVYYAHFLITGGPNETEKTTNEGFKNSDYIKQTVFFSYVGMRIYPHTPLYEFALREGTISEDTDLLPPIFYISPHVSKERIFEMMAEFNSQKRNWIVGESTPELAKMMSGLRSIGVVGPLWEFLAR